MRVKEKLTLGIGINDVDSPVMVTTETGTRLCPFYKRWIGILSREHSKNFAKRNPTYRGATVCEEWCKFSVFKAWMLKHDWENLEIDKDILIPGNKHYSPETCAFVPRSLNNILSIKSYVSKYPSGVSETSRNKTNPFIAKINVKEGVRIHQKQLGYFPNPQEAHKAWQLEKANQIEKAITWYAGEEFFQSNVADALMARVWKLRTDAFYGIETKSL